MEYAAAFAVIFGINLLPAFAPPTWALLVFLHLNWDLAPVPLILGGAVCAACGRFVLASTVRRFRERIPPERRANLKAAEEALAGSRRRELAGFGVFVVSPLPAGQLFVAAGLLTVPLVPVTIAFFLGRLVTYSIYVGAASAAAASLGDVFQKTVASPLGIALQILLLGGVVALYKVDWTRVLGRRNSGTSSDATTASIAPAANASETGKSEETSSTSM